MPLCSAVSAQGAAQLGFNCISTQLVQTPLRLTLQDLKRSLEQSQRQMHQPPLHAHKVLEGSHPCPWGTNHSISFYAGDSKSQQIAGVRVVRESKTKSLSSKALPGFAVKHRVSLIHLLFIFTKQKQNISSGHQEATALLPAQYLQEGPSCHTHRHPFQSGHFWGFLFAPDTSAQPYS